MSLAWGEAMRLAAKGGPADRLRRWLIAGCAALAAMIAAAAATIPSQHGDDVSNGSVLGRLLTDASIAPGLMTALTVLSLPVVHLAVQAVRVGAPARDRRLSGMRASGATLADVRRVVRAEVAAWCSLGAVVGLVGYYVFMWVAPRVFTVRYADIEADAANGLRSDVAGTSPVISLEVWPHPLVIIAAATMVPLVAAVLVPLAVRRAPVRGAATSRHQRRMSRGHAGAYLGSTAVAVGSVLVMIFAPVDGDTGRGRVVDLMFIPVLLGTFGLLLCTLVAFASRTSSLLGRVLVGRGGGVGVLAGRMMQAHPGLASRSAVSLVLVGFVGGMAIPLQSILLLEMQAVYTADGIVLPAAGSAPSYDTLYYTVPILAVQVLALVAGAVGLVGLLVAVAEQVSMRGRDLARQVAVGVPGRVVRRALVVEAATPVAITTSLALVIGAAVPTLSVALTGNAVLLRDVAWEWLLGFWLLLVAGAGLATWLGGFALPNTSDPQRIRDRE